MEPAPPGDVGGQSMGNGLSIGIPSNFGNTSQGQPTPPGEGNQGNHGSIHENIRLF